MWKVVIADDEVRICRLIQALIDWEKLDMELVGVASNGEEALEQVMEKQPNILITDIRMPGCSGLELIERLKQSCMELRIIIISGYAHFEYAQTAIKYGVGDYLLKPINRQQLNDTLNKMRIELETAHQQEQRQEDEAKSRASDIERVKKMLVQDLIENKDQRFQKTELQERYHFQVQEGVFQVFCLKMDYETSQFNKAAVEVIGEKISNIFQQVLEPLCQEQVFLVKQYSLYGVIHYSKKKKEEMRRVLREGFHQILAQKPMLGEMEFTLGLGCVEEDCQELGRSMTWAEQAAQERLVKGTGLMIDGAPKRHVLFEKQYLDKYSREISHAVEVFGMQELEAANQELFRAIREREDAQGWEVFELIRSAAGIFAMQLNIRSKAEMLTVFRRECMRCSSREQLFERLLLFEKKQLQSVITLRENDSVRSVRKAKQYIQKNYSRALTLEEVSEAVGLSSAYFSVLFKKETEVGFAKYLLNVRMEEAKVLLRETTLSVAEVCERVGYNDKKYFTHTFEKVAGLKPNVYRKLYG